MNKQIAIVVGALIAAASFSQAFGIVKPGWERPIKRAEMKIVDSRYGFEDARDVELTLTRRDPRPIERVLPVTGMILEYTIPGDTTQGDKDLMIEKRKAKVAGVVKGPA